jgi:hypothetical protein
MNYAKSALRETGLKAHKIVVCQALPIVESYFSIVRRETGLKAQQKVVERLILFDEKY